MAQDFESAFSTKIMSGSFTNLLASNSDDAVIGIRFSNLHSGSVTVDAKITRSSKDYQLIDGGSKVVMMNGDTLKAQASMTGSVDAIVSYIDSISE